MLQLSSAGSFLRLADGFIAEYTWTLMLKTDFNDL